MSTRTRRSGRQRSESGWAAQPSRQPLTVTGGYSKRPGRHENQPVGPSLTTDLERLACSSLEGLTAASDVDDDAAG